MGTTRVNPGQNQTAPAAQQPTQPVQNLTLSAAGRQFIIGREGMVDHFYNDSGHNCTYGVGILAHLGPCTPQEARSRPTQQQMDLELNRRLNHAQDLVRTRVQQPLTQQQFDALTSLAYNAGTNADGVFHTINAGRIQEAGVQIRQTAITAVTRRNGHTTHAVSHGLMNRRAAESAMFNGQPIPPPAPNHQPAHHAANPRRTAHGPTNAH